MNRRDFFKKAGKLAVVAAIAPKALKAEEPKVQTLIVPEELKSRANHLIDSDGFYGASVVCVTFNMEFD